MIGLSPLIARNSKLLSKFLMRNSESRFLTIVYVLLLWQMSNSANEQFLEQRVERIVIVAFIFISFVHY